MNAAAEIIHGVAHQDANIIFGTVIDDEIGDEIKVTVIAAGFDRLDGPSASGGLKLGNGGSATSNRITELFAEPEEAEPVDDDDDDFDVPSFSSSSVVATSIASVRVATCTSGARRAPTVISIASVCPSTNSMHGVARSWICNGSSSISAMASMWSESILVAQVTARSVMSAITALDDVVLGCWVADCASVVLVGAESEFAIVHAGWLGLAAGGAPCRVRCLHRAGHQSRARSGDRSVLLRVRARSARASRGRCRQPHRGHCRFDQCGRAGARRIRRSDSRLWGMVPVGTAGRLHRVRPFPGFSHRVRRDPQRHVVAVWRRP